MNKTILCSKNFQYSSRVVLFNWFEYSRPVSDHLFNEKFSLFEFCSSVKSFSDGSKAVGEFANKSWEGFLFIEQFLKTFIDVTS